MLNDQGFKSIFDLLARFKDEKSCHTYLASRRWADGELTCPHDGCNYPKAYVFKDGITYKCASCRKKFTARTGTVFATSNIPLQKWFMAMYLLMHKKGISSIQLSKDLGITQKSAWFLLHRLRHALGMDNKDVALDGQVQLDETFVGGKNKNRHHDKKVAKAQGRAFIDKTPVMGMIRKEESIIIERPHKVIAGRTVKEKVITRPSLVKCFVVANTKAETLQPIIYQNIEPGSIVVSDEWFGYRGLERDYNHQVVDHGRKQYVNNEGFSSNAMENHWTQFKLGIISTYMGVSRKHLLKYANEFTFKSNYRNLAVDSQFDAIVRNIDVRLKYKELIA